MALVATYNVNSIRARIDNVVAFLSERQPDIVLCQEIKAQKENFPYDAFKNIGYHALIVGQKSYNGVAVLSKKPCTMVLDSLPGDCDDLQARYIEVDWCGARFASIYLPNGNPVTSDKYVYKLAWMERLKARFIALLDLEIPLIMGGDYNIIPREIDCHDPEAWRDDALFLPQSRGAFRSLLNLGFYDALRIHNKAERQYTFWDYQGGAYPKDMGIRIDHFLLSAQACDRMQKCWIDRQQRGKEKASDHTPLMLEINL